jgi:hypothetical protein
MASAAPIVGAMRGLTLFIGDLRNAQTKEQEDKRVAKELAHIRNTFKTDKKMDGYDRKKYVAKLLYIHLLGYEVDFGHMEVCVGYCFVTHCSMLGHRCARLSHAR